MLKALNFRLNPDEEQEKELWTASNLQKALQSSRLSGVLNSAGLRERPELRLTGKRINSRSGGCPALKMTRCQALGKNSNPIITLLGQGYG